MVNAYLSLIFCFYWRGCFLFWQTSSSSFGFSLLGVATAPQYSLFHSIYFVSFPSSNPFYVFPSTNPSTTFLFSFCLAPPSPSSFSPRSLLPSFYVSYQRSLAFRSLSPSFAIFAVPLTYSFLILSFLSLPVPISPFSTLQFPFFPPVFPSLRPFPFYKAWLV